jgi:hypothetical protein
MSKRTIDDLVAPVIEECVSNVVDIHTFRKKMRAMATPALGPLPLFYINEGRASESTLRSFPFLDVVPIDSAASLDTALKLRVPALVLIESFVSWADPVVLINKCVHVSGCSVLMVYRPEENSKNQKLFKRAFQVGLLDTLSFPVTRDELWERLDVICRLNLRAISPY